MVEDATLSNVLLEYSRIALLQRDACPSHTAGIEPDWVLATNSSALVDDRLAGLEKCLSRMYSAPGIASIMDQAILVGHDSLCGTSGSNEKPATQTACSFPKHVLDALDHMSSTEVLEKLTLLRGLAILHGLRYVRTGDIDDLDASVCLRRKCIDAKDKDVATDEAYLCGIFGHIFEITEDFEDINTAIVHGRASLQGAYHENPMHLSKLASVLHIRYHHFRNEVDLDSVIALTRLAIKTTEETQQYFEHLRGFRNNLASALVDKLPSADQPSVIADECVDVYRQLVTDSLQDDPVYPLYLFNLAAALRSQARYVDDSDVAGLNEAIDIMQQLVDKGGMLAPTLRLQFMSHLGFALNHRYQKLQSTEDLDRSLEVTQRAVDDFRDVDPLSFDSTHIVRAKATLFHMYFDRYTRRHESSDLEASINYIYEVDPKCLPSTEMRIHFFIMSAFITHSQSRYEAAMLSYRSALGLLPQYLMLGRNYRLQALKKKYGMVDGMDDLGADAAAACVACGHFCKALELLESGRSIGWTRSLQMRSGFSRLEADHPDYADKFKQLSESLEKTELIQSSDDSKVAQSNDSMGMNEAGWESPFNMSQRWNALLAEIRLLNGYHDFLLHPDYDRLKCVSDEGPVVVINISVYRSDALILTRSTFDRPQVVRLPDDMHAATKEWSKVLLEGISSMEDGAMIEFQFSRLVLRPLLTKLWKQLVQPIRQSLAFLAPYARRIWWCPTGRLTFLPLHLVTNGLEFSDSTDIFQLIPSYTNTLSSLIRARSSVIRHEPVSMLSVSCELAAGFDKILGTKKEVEAMASIRTAGHDVTIIQGSDATVQRVLSGMSNHTWLHLACHGIQSSDEPYRSHLALSDGCLYMTDIVNTRLDKAQFAFLSACHSATGIPALSDEAMHLAAGLHFAGFCGTIATMWSVHDGTARRLAKQVYKILFRNPPASPNVEDAAEALWRASQILLRNKVPLSRIAPFMHIGV